MVFLSYSLVILADFSSTKIWLPVKSEVDQSYEIRVSTN